MKQKTKTKIKEEKAPKIAGDVINFERLIDEAGALDEQIEAMSNQIKKLATEYDAKVAEVSVAIGLDSKPKGEQVIASGREFLLKYHAMRKVKTMKADAMKRARNLIGDRIFFQICKVTLEDLKKHIPGKTLETLYTEDFGEGKRVAKIERIKQ